MALREFLPKQGSEEYYAEQEEFIRYIKDEVNPARERNGLPEIREHEARECYRILHDFWQKWRKTDDA